MTVESLAWGRPYPSRLVPIPGGTRVMEAVCWTEWNYECGGIARAQLAAVLTPPYMHGLRWEYGVPFS